MKGVVLYRSKYGSTRQYAEWISEETGFPLIDLNRSSRPVIADMDVVVIGGWILSDRMVTHSWIRKNWEPLRGKKVVLFSTSASRPTEELKRKYLERTLREEMRKGVIYFPLWGRFSIDGLNLVDGSMMKIASRMFRSDELMKEMVRGIDEVKRENLERLLENIRL